MTESASLLLASSSPRRSALLDQIGVRHQVLGTDIPEIPDPLELPETYVARIALEKARAAAKHLNTRDLPILGADTEVVLDGKIFGKPLDAKDAASMLEALSGREHCVLTALALLHPQGIATALSVSEVRFRTLTSRDIQRYLESGEPFGKAGAYAIQGLGAIFIERLSGSYSGVMGLPLHETAKLLERIGIEVPGKHDSP